MDQASGILFVIAEALEAANSPAGTGPTAALLDRALTVKFMYLVLGTATLLASMTMVLRSVRAGCAPNGKMELGPMGQYGLVLLTGALPLVMDDLKWRAIAGDALPLHASVLLHIAHFPDFGVMPGQVGGMVAQKSLDAVRTALVSHASLSLLTALVSLFVATLLFLAIMTGWPFRILNGRNGTMFMAAFVGAGSMGKLMSPAYWQALLSGNTEPLALLLINTP